VIVPFVQPLVGSVSAPITKKVAKKA